MQFLQEIIGLSYFHFYPEIDEFLPQGAKNRKLYQAIRNGEVTSDQEASRLIYGSGSVGKKYIMLKKRLKQQVTDNYFRLLSQTNEVAPAALQRRLDYLKQLTIVYTLMGQGRYPLARQLLHYQQKTAAAHFDLAAVQEGTELLRRIAGYQGDRSAFRRYNAQLQRASQQARYLQEARNCYELVRAEHRRHVPPSAVVADLAHEYTTRVQRWQQEYSHPAIGFYGRLLRLTTQFHQGNLSPFRRTLFFQQQQVERHPPLASYDVTASADLLAMEYLSTQHPEDRSEVAKKTVRGSRDESLPVTAWLALREVEYTHWLRATDYRRAEQLCQQLETEVGGETLVMPLHDQARWALFHAYASYLLRSVERRRGTMPMPSEKSVAALETVVQPLLVDSIGYGWQWFTLKILLWHENPFLPKKHFLRQIDAYARRHSANQSERTNYFFRKVRSLVAGQRDRELNEASELPWPVLTDHDRLRELVSYEVLWKSANVNNNAREDA